MGLIAIIGGTGVCDPKILSNVHEDYMDTLLRDHSLLAGDV